MHRTNNSPRAPGSALISSDPPLSRGHRAQNKRGTILLVDDEPAVLEGLRIGLRKEPFAVAIAGSAAQALRMLAQVRFDAVITDEHMPSMTGSELLSLVRKDFPETIRIMLTGQPTLDAAMRAINGGEIYRFLTKPCTAAHLGLTLRQALILRAQATGRAATSSPAARQHEELAALERAYPGITQIRRGADGGIAINAGEDGGEERGNQALERRTEAS